MKPPICELCDVRFEPSDGGLVTFAATPQSEAWHARAAAEPGFVGHPPELAWFCPSHLSAAQALADRPLAEALRALASAPPPRRTAGDGGAVGPAAVPCPPTSPAAVHDVFLAHATHVAAILGWSELPELRSSSQRRWHPMDGCVPPECPYAEDTITTSEAGDGATLRIARTESWWNPTEPATASVSIELWDAARRPLGAIRAVSDRVEGRAAIIEELVVDLPPGAPAERALAAIRRSLGSA